MKKLLLLSLGLSGLLASAQTIVTENFENIAIGNLGTSTAGNVAGANNWLTLYGANSDYQIATTDAAHNKSLVINGFNGYDFLPDSVDNSRIAARLNSVTANATNDIVQTTFEIYTGSNTGVGEVNIDVRGVDGTSTIVPVGFSYNLGTREIKGRGQFIQIANNTRTLYSIGFQTGGYMLPANTWVTLSCKYNKTTGAVSWTLPAGTASYTADTNAFRLIPNFVGKDLYIVNNALDGNTVSNTIKIDNINMLYGNTASLGVNDANLSAVAVRNEVSVYPNPAKDVLNIQADQKINGVTIYDMSGKKINAELKNNTVNVSELSAGSYLINIETKEGNVSKKFIKK